jgi:alkaline phosphatase
LKNILFPLMLLVSTMVVAQPLSYTTANAHSHNDYEQPVPLTTAYNAKFGSIEADIFWRNGELLVAHTEKELATKHRTLEELYLKPLQAYVEKNKGYIYADTARSLQFMIDLKTNGDTTLGTLVELLKKYPTLTHCTKLKIAISGNRPDVSTWASYPTFIWFDGELQKEYPAEALARIVMLSSDFKNYTKWNGKNRLPGAQYDSLQQVVMQAHKLRKPVRFWGAPDNKSAWVLLTKLQVDYINTDKIKALADFLKNIRRIYGV